jgi:hypothetical protein
VTHRQFQAVDEDGRSVFIGPTVVSLEGILLNNPEEWLDPTPDPTVAPNFLGGQWEIFIQGENDPNGNPDEAGTACWMGQNYTNRTGSPGMSYSNEAWLAELYRLNRDPDTMWVFRAGDRIRVTGRHLFFGGKRNINEQHVNDPAYDFTVELIKPAAGLPQPIDITLADLRDEQNIDIFDPNRFPAANYTSRAASVWKMCISPILKTGRRTRPLRFRTARDGPSRCVWGRATEFCGMPVRPSGLMSSEL